MAKQINYREQPDDTELWVRACELTDNLFKNLGMPDFVSLHHWGRYQTHHSAFCRMLLNGDIQ